MKREMRRKDRLIDLKEAFEILNRCEYGILSTVGSDNIPYGVPLSYIVLDNHIYFHCARVGHKLDNIKHNNKVSFTVVGKTLPALEEDGPNFTTFFESVIIFGSVIEVEEMEEKIHALKVLCEKYLSEHMLHFDKAMEASLKMTNVYKISIDSISGKAKK